MSRVVFRRFTKNGSNEFVFVNIHKNSQWLRVKNFQNHQNVNKYINAQKILCSQGLLLYHLQNNNAFKIQQRAFKKLAFSNIACIYSNNEQHYYFCTGVISCTRVRKRVPSITFYFKFLVIHQAVNLMEVLMLKNFNELSKISVSNCSVRKFSQKYQTTQNPQICQPTQIVSKGQISILLTHFEFHSLIFQICKIHYHRWIQYFRRQRANCPIQNPNVAHFQKQPSVPLVNFSKTQRK